MCLSAFPPIWHPSVTTHFAIPVVTSVHTLLDSLALPLPVFSFSLSLCPPHLCHCLDISRLSDSLCFLSSFLGVSGPLSPLLVQLSLPVCHCPADFPPSSSLISSVSFLIVVLCPAHLGQESHKRPEASQLSPGQSVGLLSRAPDWNMVLGRWCSSSTGGAQDAARLWSWKQLV